MTERTKTLEGHARAADLARRKMGDRTQRKTLGYAPQMLMMRNAFETAVQGPRHSHPHVQPGYTVSGLFDITIGGVSERLGPGDGFPVPGSVEHGATCIEAGELVEVFTPIRDESV